MVRKYRFIQTCARDCVSMRPFDLPVPVCWATTLFRFDLQVALVDSRKFDNGDEIIALLEDVDWR